MQAAAAIAAGLIVTAPQSEAAAPRTLEPPAEVKTLPPVLEFNPIRELRPGEGCSVAANNAFAVMDGNGAVYLYMSKSEQLRRFGKVQEVYLPGDSGYSLATSYASQGLICGGGGTSVEVSGAVGGP